jgi:hypothetical protein
MGNWLPAAKESDPVRLVFLTLPPEHYELFALDAVAIRWNDQILPAHTFPASLYPGHPVAALEFTVPAALCVPGFTEFVLWNTRDRMPLPYRGWISFFIQTKATVFEVDPSSDRVVAAVGADGTGSGSGGQIEIYRLSTGTLIDTVAIAPTQRVLAFTPDAAYAWISQDEANGRLALMNLASGSIVQQVQIAGGSPPYTLSAQVYRQDPRILIVTASAPGYRRTQAYAGGVRLPNDAPNVALESFQTDDRGRLLLWGGHACELKTSAGFANCVDLLPAPFTSTFQAVWKNRGLTGGDVIDLTTGAKLLELGGAEFTAGYLPESNRVFFNRYATHMVIADGDSLELWARLGNEIPDCAAEGPRRLWAPDWILMRTAHGILVGRLPQLAPAPSIAPEGVVHAATFQHGPIAPGEIISIFGQNLGPARAAGPVIENRRRFATEVERTEVRFDDVAGAVLYAGAGQINVVVPESVQGKDSVTMQVVHYGIPSARIQLQAAPYNPGFFGYTAQGRTYAAALSGGVTQGPARPCAAEP